MVFQMDLIRLKMYKISPKIIEYVKDLREAK